MRNWYSLSEITLSITSLMFAATRSERDWRAKVRRFSTIFLQRRALPSIFSMSRRDHCSPGRERKSCAKPRMPERGLLSSCATPLTISPIAFSFSDWWSWFASSFSREMLRARTSTPLRRPALGDERLELGRDPADAAVGVGRAELEAPAGAARDRLEPRGLERRAVVGHRELASPRRSARARWRGRGPSARRTRGWRRSRGPQRRAGGPRSAPSRRASGTPPPSRARARRAGRSRSRSRAGSPPSRVRRRRTRRTRRRGRSPRSGSPRRRRRCGSAPRSRSSCRSTSRRSRTRATRRRRGPSGRS